MSKESFGCAVSCDPFGHSGDKGEFKGPHTHCRSEGTWILNVALNMARHGHPTTIFGYQWGDQLKYPLPSNITLQKDIGGEFDIYIDAGWDNTYAPERAKKINANIYIHGWGGSPWSSHLLDFISIKHHFFNDNYDNHYMARPSRAFWKEYISYPKGIYMPTPLVDKIRTRGNFSSTQMLWGNRGAFNKEYAQDSEKVLDFMERNQDYHYKVLLWGDIIEKSNLIGRNDIPRRFEQLKDKELIEPYIGIGHDEFVDELGKSKILLDTGHPQEHPQNLEAVCMGAIPLIWKKSEHHFQEFYESDSHDSWNINEEIEFQIDGINGIDKILNDENLYQYYFTCLEISCKDHEYDNAYNILMKEINEKLQ